MADAAEDTFIEETESLLRDAGNSVGEQSEAGNEVLPAHPFRFVLHFVNYYKWLLIGIASCELGQAACQILIPKAVQRIIDAASVVNPGNESVWTALAGPMRFFLLLNIGILIFSRSSGSMLVLVGPNLRRRVRKRQLHPGLGRHASTEPAERAVPDPVRRYLASGRARRQRPWRRGAGCGQSATR